MIDLNKKLVSKEGLLEYINELDVYQYYTGKEVTLSGNMISPIRAEKTPSFGYFVSKTGEKEILFNDFKIGGGDFVKFVQLKFGLNYFEALSKIAIDMNIDDHFIVKDMKKSNKVYDPNKYQTNRQKLLSTSNSVKIGRKVREWKLYDLNFWYQFGITKDVLNLYNVEPISYLFLNNVPIVPEKYSYCFPEFKDDTVTYKIYQPYSEDYKWLTNHDASVWQGWRQLPEKNEFLIITSSLKDAMSIVSTTNYPAIALQNEGIKPKESVVKELHNRFDCIYLLYDNDFDKEVNWGREFGKDISEKNRFFQIEIPEKYNSKDYSDLIKNIGVKNASELLVHLQQNYMPF
jgi:hypothetical protein